MVTVQRRLNSTRAQLETVEKELGGWTPKTAQEGQWKVADHEDEKGRITEIFERINEARVQFEVCAASSFSHLSY